MRTDPDAPEAQGHHLADHADGLARASRCGRCGRSPARREFSEMFLDEVRIPVANRVGAENDGWRVAMVTFSLRARHGVRRRAARDTMSLSSATLADAGPTRARARVGRRRAAPRARPHRRGARRAVGADKRNVTQAERGTGVPGARRLGVQARATREVRQPAGRPADALLGRAALSLDDSAGWTSASTSSGWFHVDVADHRRGHVADPAQHRRRAHPRPPEGAGAMNFELDRRRARAPARDARRLQAVVPHGPGRVRSRTRGGIDRTAVARARPSRRLLAAAARGGGRRRARDDRGRARLRGARPGARARPACLDAPRGAG